MAYTIERRHGSYNVAKRVTAPRYIVVHYTGSGTSRAGSAAANCAYFGRANRNASAHYFIDDSAVCEYADPAAYATWHVGDGHGRYGVTNQNSIGIEVCSGGADFTEAETDRLAWLVGQLMERFNVPASRVVRHYDASRKACPYPYVPNGGDPNGAKWSALHARITGAASTSAATAQTTDSATTKPTSAGTALAVDGWLGKASVSAMQRAMGTPVDGVVSGQYAGNKKYLARLVSVQWGKGGSTLVRAIQKKLGCSADGYMGPNTVRAIQRHVGAGQDGYLGPDTAKKVQQALNAGKFLTVERWTLELCRTNASGRIERESLRTFRSERDMRRWMYANVGAARTEWYHSTHVCRVIV